MRFFHETLDGPKPFSQTEFFSTTQSGNLILSILIGKEQNHTSAIAVWGQQYGWHRFVDNLDMHMRLGHDTEYLWTQLDLGTSLENVSRMHWFMDDQRCDDLGIKVLGEFKKSVATGTKPRKKIVGHLPPEKIEDIIEGLSFKPVQNPYPRGGRAGLSVGIASMGLIFHAAHLGLSPKATRQMFKHELPASAYGAARRFFVHYYRYQSPGWDWSQNANSAQKALFQPRRARI